MKIAILIHENDQWVSYPHDNSKIDHVSTTTSGECFFFDPVERSATSAMPQQATKDDPRAGNLYISFKFDENELNWFLNDLSCIKGFKEWMKNITKAKAKEYALEPLSKLPEAEIKGKAKEFDENSAPLNDAEKKIALQMMTAVIQTIIQNENPKIFVGAKGQRDDLVIAVLKSLPKALRKVTVSMPWSAGMDLARITITDEDKLPNISSPRYVVSESSDALMTQYPNRFAVAEMFFEDNCWAEDKSFEQEDVSVVCKFVELAEEKERKLIRGWYESWVKSGRSQDLSEIVKKDRFKRELDDNNIQKRFTEKDYSDIWACYNAAYKIDKDIKYDQVIKLYDYCKKVVKDKKNTIPEILNNPDFCRLCIEAIKEGKNLEALKVYEFCEDGKNIIGQQHPVLGLCEYWIKVNSEKKNATFEKISYVYSKFGDLDLSFYEFLTEIVSWEDVKYFDHTYFEKLYNLYSDLPDKSKFRNYYKCYIKAVDIKVELSVILTSDFYEFCANVVKENEDPDPAYLLRIYEIRRKVDHNKHDLFDSVYYKCCNDARTDEELRSVVLDLDFCRWYINVAANNAELSAFDNVRCFKLCKKYFKKEWEEPNAGKRFHNLGKIYELYRKVYKILDEQCFARFYKLCKETGLADQPNITDFARFYAWSARTKKYSRFTPARVELSRILTSDVYKFYEKVARLPNYKDMKPSEISALCGNYLKAVKFEDEGRLVKADEVFKGYSQEVLDIFKGMRSKKSDKNKGKRGRKTVSKWDGRKLFAGLCVVVLAVGVVAAWKFGFKENAEAINVGADTAAVDIGTDVGTDLSEEAPDVESNILFSECYSQIQDGMSKFVQDHITGSVFAYRPSNGDIYCIIDMPEIDKIISENKKEMCLKYNRDKKDKQPSLVIYSKQFDLAAYIVKNCDEIDPEKCKSNLESISNMLTELVAEDCLGTEFEQENSVPEYFYVDNKTKKKAKTTVPAGRKTQNQNQTGKNQQPRDNKAGSTQAKPETNQKTQQPAQNAAPEEKK